MTRRPTRRIAVLTATAASISLALAGCSSSSSGGGSTVDLSQSAPTGVTLTMWRNSGDSDALTALYKAYEKESGNTIDVVSLPTDTYPTAVQTKWATGDRPDILEYIPSPQDMAQLDMKDNMIDLSSFDFVKAEGDLATTNGEVDGKVYGAILGPVSTFGVFYNKKVLAKAGISVPTSYTQLQSDCSALTSAGATPLFVGAGSEFPANMLGFAYMADFNAGDAYGKAVASGKTKVNDPSGPLVAGLTAINKLRTTGCLNKDAATATSDAAVKAVANGTAAMTILPSDFISQFVSAAGSNADDLGFGTISASKGIASYSPGSYGSYFLPKTGDSTKQRAAADFIQYITGKGYQSYVTAANIVPTLSTATAPSLTGMYASMRSMLTAPTSVIAWNNSIPGFGNFGKIAVSVVAGQVTPQKAADNFETFVDQAIAAQK